MTLGSLNSACQNNEVNRVSRSLIIFVGTPYLQIIWSKINLAESAADTSTVVGISVNSLLNLSTTVKMQSYAREVTGRNVAKSMAICSKGLEGTK